MYQRGLVMTKAIFLIGLLLLSAWLGIQLQGNPGYILVATEHWRIQSTLWVGIAAIIVLFFVLYLFFVIYQRLAHFPAVLNRWTLKRRALRAHDKTTQGLIAFSEGYFDKARNYLVKALPNSDTPLINYLISARAAQKLGETKMRDQYLREAQQSMPDAKIAVELTQAQLQLEHQQWEQALATLRHLHDLAPTHPYVLKLLSELYEAIADWHHLIALLPSLNKQRVFTSQKREALMQRAYLGAIQHALAQKQLKQADTYFQSLPKSIKHDAKIIATYCQAIIMQDKHTEAELYLRRTLQKNIAVILVETYSMLPITLARTPFIESLLKQHTHKASIHLCLGTLYFKQQLFGKAQTHFEDSIRIQPSAKAYLSLGQLMDKLEDTKAAYRAYKHGLQSIENIRAHE